MLENIISLIAPHHCVCCSEQGSLFCEPCRQDLLESRLPACAMCDSPTRLSLLCTTCHIKSPLDDIWSVGLYKDELESLIKKYKFERARAADEIFSGLLDEVVPVLPPDTLVTYIPTAPSRIRQRGYDHMQRVASRFAGLRQLEMIQPIKRLHNKRQVGASRTERIEQAKKAFGLNKTLNTQNILLIDDVMTTGATLNAAARLLKSAGTKNVYGAVVAFEPMKNN